MDILATDLYLVPMVLRYLMMWVISTCSMEATLQMLENQGNDGIFVCDCRLVCPDKRS